MTRLYSNGPAKDLVISALQKLSYGSRELYVAAPYVTRTEELLQAANGGSRVRLIVGLNLVTTPQAIEAIHNRTNCTVRYFTDRFHAKIYLTDKAALIGSSNLTDGGLCSNREAALWVDSIDDLEDIRALFNELWESSTQLTDEVLHRFRAARATMTNPGPALERRLQDLVGKSEPVSIRAGSGQRSERGIFFEQLQRRVYEYRAAFDEVRQLLEANRLRREELKEVGGASETNRFLNWVRLTFAHGDEWKGAPLRPAEEREKQIIELGRKWTQTSDNKVPDIYLEWLTRARTILGNGSAIRNASQEELTDALCSIHAFDEQKRFVGGGRVNLGPEFWRQNENNVIKVKNTLAYLVDRNGDFIERLQWVLYDPAAKLRMFGVFCALELYGTVNEQFPPVNGRTAKALRYLGFDVEAD